MKITQVNVNYFVMRKTNNKTFKARFSQDTIGKMAEVDKNPNKPTPAPYEDIFAINQRIKEYGHRETSIDIGEPKEEILVKEEFAPQSKALEHYEKHGTFIIENEYPAYVSVLKFTNPMTDNVAGFLTLAEEGELDDKPYVTIANSVTSKVIMDGEANLLHEYIKRSIKYAKNSVERAEEILKSFSEKNFSSGAINIVRQRLKR